MGVKELVVSCLSTLLCDVNTHTDPVGNLPHSQLATLRFFSFSLHSQDYEIKPVRSSVVHAYFSQKTSQELRSAPYFLFFNQFYCWKLLVFGFVVCFTNSHLFIGCFSEVSFPKYPLAFSPKQKCSQHFWWLILSTFYNVKCLDYQTVWNVLILAFQWRENFRQ